MFNFKKSLVALIAVLTLYSAAARANSFTITNVQGSAFLTTSIDGGPPTLRRPPDFHLFGPGLSITSISPFAFGGDPGNVELRDICLTSACTSGRLLGTNSTFSGTLALQGASAIVDGVQFPFIRLTGSLNFTSSPIVLPTFGSTVPEVTLPFSFSGNVTGVNINTLAPIFTATLSGQGVAIVRFEQVFGTELNPRYRLLEIQYQFGPVPISIDIKPATFPNSINPKSKGKIPLAILTTNSFDATAVDPTTVRFGATGIEAGPVHSATEDVDGDGDLDLVLHFVTQDTGITCGNTSASLTGATFIGVRFTGSDSIETVACK